MAFRTIRYQSLEFITLTLYGKRLLADVIKCRIMRWGDYPGRTWWAPNAIMSLAHERGRRRCGADRREIHSEEKAVCRWSQRWERHSHKTGNIGSHQKLEGARHRFSHRAFRGSFQTSEYVDLGQKIRKNQLLGRSVRLLNQIETWRALLSARPSPGLASALRESADVR